MNVASRELCIELKNLSQWGETDFCWNGDHLTPAYWPEDMRSKDLDSNPAYDCGYLLRKLPDELQIDGRYRHLSLFTDADTWGIAYGGKVYKHYSKRGATPEDAACKLAIELFKQGILQP